MTDGRGCSKWAEIWGPLVTALRGRKIGGGAKKRGWISAETNKLLAGT